MLFYLSRLPKHIVSGVEMVWRYAGLAMMGVAIVLAIVQMVVYGGQLPERVASHFDAQGIADGWMSRSAFLGLGIGMQLGVSGLIILFAWAIPRLPDSLINIPNRHYWLDESRRSSTLRINQYMLLLIGGITAVLLIVIFQMTIIANLQPTPNLSGPAIWLTLGLYLVAVIGICGWMAWRFGRIPKEG